MSLTKNKSLGLGVAAALFALVAIVHGLRVITHFSVAINGQELPMVASVLAMAGSVFMSAWLWMLRSSDS